jgi:hypothetical protein
MKEHYLRQHFQALPKSRRALVRALWDVEIAEPYNVKAEFYYYLQTPHIAAWIFSWFAEKFGVTMEDLFHPPKAKETAAESSAAETVTEIAA